tara:strand:- start:171 stop:590 length:420 start_codon:yes stop_codon:yes gene_type:complete
MSTLKVNTIQNTSGGSSSTPEQIEQGRAKVWASVNGTGTAAFNDSFNCSSLTDNGDGDFTVSFSITMANTNYCVTSMSENWETLNSDSYTVISGMHNDNSSDMRQTSSFRFRCIRLRFDSQPPQFKDSRKMDIAVFGDV